MYNYHYIKLPNGITIRHTGDLKVSESYCATRCANVSEITASSMFINNGETRNRSSAYNTVLHFTYTEKVITTSNIWRDRIEWCAK